MFCEVSEYYLSNNLGVIPHLIYRGQFLYYFYLDISSIFQVSQFTWKWSLIKFLKVAIQHNTLVQFGSSLC